MRSIIVALLLATLVTGCGQLQKMNNTSIPGRVVAISTFKCNCDPIVVESVRDSFVNVFFEWTNAKPIKADAGYIVIVGTITMEGGSASISSANISGRGGLNVMAIGGKSSSTTATGNFATAVMTQAYKDGELIATYVVTQNIGQEGGMRPAVALAADAAYYLSKILVKNNEINWK